MRTKKSLNVVWTGDMDVTDILMQYKPELLDYYSDMIESLQKGTKMLCTNSWSEALNELIISARLSEKILDGLKDVRIDAKEPYSFSIVFDSLFSNLDDFVRVFVRDLTDVISDAREEKEEKVEGMRGDKKTDHKCTDSCEERDQNEGLVGGTD